MIHMKAMPGMWLIPDQLEGETAGKDAHSQAAGSKVCAHNSNKNLSTHEVTHNASAESAKRHASIYTTAT